MGRRYDQEGRVRKIVHLKAAYTKGVLENYSERHWVLSASPRRPRCSRAKGGPMTACSMARFLKVLDREAGTAGASSNSGRRTLITRLAERGIDLKAIAEVAGHTSIRTTAR